MRINLDIPIMAWEIAKFTSGICNFSDIYKKITHITLNSKLAENGDLFIPLKGTRFNGSDFIPEVLEKGAFVISDKIIDNSISVKNTDTALLNIAKGYKEKLKNLKHTIAITGSVGKSTTKEFLRKITSQKFNVHASDGNYNNTVGVPITVLKANKDTEILILEAGMNHFGELKSISEAMNPDIAVITNIGNAHIGNLGSLENIAKAKKEIISKATNKVFVPYGEPFFYDIENKITVSVTDSLADIYISPEAINTDGSYCSVYKSGALLFPFYISIPGEHILKCLASAVAVSEFIGEQITLIKSSIESLSYKDIRQHFIHFKDFSIYDDSYNSSPEALDSAFKLLSLDKSTAFSAVLGDMLELGAQTERLHFEAGALAARHRVRKLYLFGVYAPFIMRGALSYGMKKNDIFINTDTTSIEITAKQILENRKKGEIILLKASNALNLSRVCEYIKLLEG